MKSIFSCAFSGLVLAFLVACSSSSSSNDGSGSSGSVNKFSASSRAMTATDLAPATRAGTQAYYGSFLYKNGADYYAGGINFTLENNGTNVYFKTLAFEKVVLFNTYNSSGSVATTGVSCFSNGSHNATTNFINVSDTTSRFVKFSVNVGGVCTGAGFSDISNAGVVFSNDFVTMAGGDNSSFFFMAQKATAQGTFSLTDVDGTSSLYWFTVDGSGNPSAVSGNAASVTTTNGSWQTTSSTGSLKLVDSAIGSYLFKYSTTGASSIDGGFIMTPNKSFLLGIDLTSGYYFASSR